MILDLARILPQGIIHQDRITRLAYARDASVYRLVPESVVRPKNKSHVKSLLNYGRSTKTPITFRTAGTSLSGQSVSSGIIAETLYDWQKFKVLDGGESILLQPGVNGAFANKILNPYQRRIGPDPASINVARIGGIISNNSSGMVCGTQFNSYHTLKNISFILANGHEYDTAQEGEQKRFELSERSLAYGLMRIRKEILDHPELVETIRRKYRLKNTIGYSMNAFLDYETPLDIFSHLLVGAEGTLAFISNATLTTIPDPPVKGTGLILFSSPESAAESVPFFKDLGASAIEFMDDQSLRTAKHFENPPYDPFQIQDDATGLLVEFQKDTSEDVAELIDETKQFVQGISSVQELKMVTDEKDREVIWNIRKGLYPTLGSLRKLGTSVITEDIAVDAENLAPAIRELKSMFKNRDFHDGVIFGHARDGNLHFLVSVDLNSSDGEKRFEGLMNDLSDMTLGKFNGSLKAEHGTGRNMAPFVETEWGGPIYDLMWQVKRLADPYHILNPDVLLSNDPKLHVKNLKPLPRVHAEVDRCIECGFCEKICPSRGLTLTPRQRIAVMREAQEFQLNEFEIRQFNHFVNETCATDGLCEIECPVNINTGKMVKELRSPGNMDPWNVKFLARHFQKTVSGVRFGLGIIAIMRKILGSLFTGRIFNGLNKTTDGLVPILPKRGFNLSQPILPKVGSNPDYIHFPSCVNRVLPGNGARDSSSMLLQEIASVAEVNLVTMPGFENNCCGLAFESRGYRQTGNQMRGDVLDQLKYTSCNGSIPIVVDMSPCTQFIKEGSMDYGLEILDSVEFLSRIKSDLAFNSINEPIFVHPVCSSRKLDMENELIQIVKECANSIETSMEPFCCGAGGDRGFRYPSLTENSVVQSVSGITCRKGVSSSRTCELSLGEHVGIDFISIEALVYQSIQK